MRVERKFKAYKQLFFVLFSDFQHFADFKTIILKIFSAIEIFEIVSNTEKTDEI